MNLEHRSHRGSACTNICLNQARTPAFDPQHAKCRTHCASVYGHYQKDIREEKQVGEFYFKSTNLLFAFIFSLDRFGCL